MSERERDDGGGRDRRLLVAADESWRSVEARPRTGLQSLGDEGAFLEAIIGGMMTRNETELHSFDLSETIDISEIMSSDDPPSILFEEWPFSSIGTCDSTSGSVTPRAEGSESSTVSMVDADDFPSTITEIETIDDSVPFVNVMYLDALSMPGPSSEPQTTSREEQVEQRIVLPLDMPGPSSFSAGEDYTPSAPPLPATLPQRYEHLTFV